MKGRKFKKTVVVFRSLTKSHYESNPQRFGEVTLRKNSVEKGQKEHYEHGAGDIASGRGTVSLQELEIPYYKTEHCMPLYPWTKSSMTTPQFIHALRIQAPPQPGTKQRRMLRQTHRKRP